MNKLAADERPLRSINADEKDQSPLIPNFTTLVSTARQESYVKLPLSVGKERVW